MKSLIATVVCVAAGLTLGDMVVSVLNEALGTITSVLRMGR